MTYSFGHAMKKDLTDYFERSPKGDTSPGSLKENDDSISPMKSPDRVLPSAKDAEVLKQNISNISLERASCMNEQQGSIPPKGAKPKTEGVKKKRSLSTKSKNAKALEGENIVEPNKCTSEIVKKTTTVGKKSSGARNVVRTNSCKVLSKTHANSCQSNSLELSGLDEAIPLNDKPGGNCKGSDVTHSETADNSAEKQKIGTSITHFFSPPKMKNSAKVELSKECVDDVITVPSAPPKKESCEKARPSETKKPRAKLNASTSVSKGKKMKLDSTKKGISNGQSEPKPSESETKEDQQISLPGPCPVSVKAKIPQKKTVRSVKKKLSLPKELPTSSNITADDEPVPLKCEERLERSEKEEAKEQAVVLENIKNALQHIMVKGNADATKPSDQVTTEKASTKKRKKSTSSKTHSPRKRRTVINEDSVEEHVERKAFLSPLCKKNIPLQNVDDEIGDQPAELLSPKADDSRHKGLKNYFQIVTKEEALSKTEKVELKVSAMVHSPPTTPSKKEKKRSVNNLPGSALSGGKKKGKSVKARLKDNFDAIDVIAVEEIIPSDGRTSHLPGSETVDVSKSQAGSMKVATRKIRTSPRKPSVPITVLEEKDVSKLALSSEKSPMKVALSVRTSPRKVATPKSLKSTKKSSAKSHKTPNRDGSGVSKVSPKGTSKKEQAPHLNECKPPSLAMPKTPNTWKLRVCLSPHVVPSSQGTMEEEDSDLEEIFLVASKKRRIDNEDKGKMSTDVMERRRRVKGKAEKKIPEPESTIKISPEIVFEKEMPAPPKQGMKVAPLFVRKEKAQARQQFLLSGVPEQVKKIVEIQRCFEEQEAELFPLISHVQQQTKDKPVWNLISPELVLKPEIEEEPLQVTPGSLTAGSLMECEEYSEDLKQILSFTSEGPRPHVRQGFPTSVVKPILRLIRKEAPNFKVVNTYTVLREKVREERQAATAAASLAEVRKGRRRSSSKRSSKSSKELIPIPVPSQVWTEKYKPSSASEIVGNSESVLQMKRWLETWRRVSEDARKQGRQDDVQKRKKKKKKDDDDEDGDDFIIDNSSDEDKSSLPTNPALLYGQSGCGKTCSVYALANDLGYKVLEINASEKRNGKVVLAKLSEATQSHQVQRSNSSEQGFAALFGGKTEKPSTPKRKKPKVEVIEVEDDNSDEKTLKMSLILVDDVDIVFEDEDEGFISALVNLISTSKRPVILTTSDPDSPYLTRFFNSSSLLLYFTSPREPLCTWLQLVSLLEGVYTAPSTIKALVSLCGGDVRRALLQMQVWVTTGGNNLPLPPMPVIVPNKSGRKRKKGSDESLLDHLDDDLSDMCAENDSSVDCMPVVPANTDCVGALLGRNDIMEVEAPKKCSKVTISALPQPLNVGLLWWNLPSMLGFAQISHAPLPTGTKEAPLQSGPRKMLDDSFLAAFCSEDELSNGPVDECTDDDCTEGDIPNNHNDVDVVEDESSSNCSTRYVACCKLEEMTAMMRQLVSLSTIDMISSCTHLPEVIDSDEPVSRFWQKPAKNSLLLYKPVVMGPNCTMESTSRGLCHWLGERTILETRNCLQINNPEKNIEEFSDFDSCLPSCEERRWRCVYAECEQALLQAVPLCVQLDRRALAADYMSALQTMSCLEQTRSTINVKRRNRFYHYLKGIGVSLTERQLEILCHRMRVT